MLNVRTKQNSTVNLRLVQAIAKETRGETLARLHASADGLSSKQASINREEYGANEIASNRHDSRIRFLIEAFLNPFTIVLLLLATISLCTDYLFVPSSQKDLSTVIIMLVMVIISGLTSYIQNVRTSNAVEALLGLVSVTTNIRRDGENQELPTTEVVVGDIINLAAGDMVPADMRLLQSKDLFCSSSSLNGESNPVEKVATKFPRIGRDNDYLDYPNILYEGSDDPAR